MPGSSSSRWAISISTAAPTSSQPKAEASGRPGPTATSSSPDGGFALDLWTGFADDGGQLFAGRLQTMPTSFPVAFLRVADLNGDGIPDILAVSEQYSLFVPATPHIMVFLGTCP